MESSPGTKKKRGRSSEDLGAAEEVEGEVSRIRRGAEVGRSDDALPMDDFEFLSCSR